jgi:Flp pilus assembly protein TadB
MTPFFASQIGEIVFYGGLVWMGIGIFVMRQMINFRI